MSFSKKIKEDILVASARHCSMCHSYKGLKVEVHHITPKVQGGNNSESNAISLCFDCHADAGHYFADHPKGTKVSPRELRKHKKSWEKLVTQNLIPIPKRDLVYIQHIITDSFHMIKELSETNLENFPIKNSLLVKTPVLKFIQNLIKDQDYRHSTCSSYKFKSETEYLEAHPKAILLKNNGEYNGYTYNRIPSSSEIKEVCSGDSVTQYLLENKCELDKICISGTHSDGCEGLEFMESYITRPMYMTMLAIENITDEPISIDSLVGNISEGVLYNSLNKTSSNNNIHLPQMKIMPNKTLIIPTAIILSDFESFEIDNESTINRFYVGNEQRQEFQKISIKTKPNQYDFIGPSLLIQAVQFNNRLQSVHELDMNNLYHIDRYYMCGSCPHLFFVKNNGKLEYVRELFFKSPDRLQIEKITISKDVKAVIVVELENELTFIESISLNKKVSLINEELNKGMYKIFPVIEDDYMEIKGKYSFFGKELFQLSVSEKQNIIRKFIKNFDVEIII